MGYALFERSTAEQYHDVDLDDARQLDERRTNDRTTTVFRPALIRIDDFRSLCLVRNISPSGMMAKVYSPIAMGETITVEFGTHLSATGKVAWAEEGQIGVRFKDPLNVVEVLTETGKRGPGNKINRPLRLEIDAQGEIEINGIVRAFEVQDISQRGLKAKVSANLAPNEEVMVRLTGLEPRRAVVRWIRPGEVGLNFTRPLGMDELATWVVHQQTS